MGKVIGVISLKGGVGKTSSVISLASALSYFGKSVLIVDANFSAPNVGIHLDIINPEKNLYHVLRGEAKIKEAIYPHSLFHVLPTETYPKKKFEPLKLKKKIGEIKNDYDYILIDSSPSLNDETLAAMVASDELFVVSTPDYSTLAMTMKAINLSKKQGAKISGIILNKVYDKNFELTIEDIEKLSEVPVLASVPHDRRVLEAQANFITPVFHSPKSEYSTEYKRLASVIAREKYKPFRFREIFSLSPKRQEVNRILFYKQVFNLK